MFSFVIRLSDGSEARVMVDPRTRDVDVAPANPNGEIPEPTAADVEEIMREVSARLGAELISMRKLPDTTVN